MRFAMGADHDGAADSRPPRDRCGSRSELGPSWRLIILRLGRPSIDPVLMIRMLIVGYVFAIRSERALCRDVRVNLAYRWFCGLGIEEDRKSTRLNSSH